MCKIKKLFSFREAIPFDVTRRQNANVQPARKEAGAGWKLNEKPVAAGGNAARKSRWQKQVNQLAQHAN